MTMGYLTADELLAGSSITHDIPLGLAMPAAAGGSDDPAAGGVARVRMRPLTVRDIQKITKAARDDEALLSALMLKEGMVEPALSFDQIQGLPAGLAKFLLGELNRISGLAVTEDEMEDAVSAPLARACFVLAREFGWSPQEVGELTIGQLLLYMEMVSRGNKPAEAI
jgi:hypothetical protein